MSTKNWRVINNNMIQTHAEEVFLWDNKEGVAIRVHVPSRPWKKIDPAFEAWMSADGWMPNAFPTAPIDLLPTTKIAYDDGAVTYVDDGGATFFEPADFSF
jgi:hypothetical protein